MICSEPDCNEDQELNNINFIPNKQMKNGYLLRCRKCYNKNRVENKPKGYYCYEIIHKGENLKGRIKSSSKKMAMKVLKFKYRGCEITTLYSWSYFIRKKRYK